MEIEEKFKEYGKLYQDQLYGTITLSPLAIHIIDTPEFQRLSHIKQLGFTDLVYRGAQHTRFCHSIGTYFLTRTIMRHIVKNHERLGLGHPGELLPDYFCMFPYNAYPKETDLTNISVSNQSLWRGLIEVVSIAALIHDIGHVPFGHTLEDEFAGIYNRHDKLAGPRLYELLFNENSSIRQVFSDIHPNWIRGLPNRDEIKNEELSQLIYIILSWKDQISPPKDFSTILNEEMEILKGSNSPKKKRLKDLISWYHRFKENRMFQPFMTDIIGNTICVDLLDYLPRDRMNLGMEYRYHKRIFEYLTIREGQLYKDEGKRISIMVTRPGRGGQRRDVATAVLDIMRERYEMAERVYYHHKKAAASSMLAKLAKLSLNSKPRDDEKIYPAPWNSNNIKPPKTPNMVHLSDMAFIDFLGTVKIKEGLRDLQKRLYNGLRFDRKLLYRTLLVIDSGLIQLSPCSINYFIRDLREDKNGDPSNEGLQELEQKLAKAADVENGEVLVYCPSPNMQSKEVDARLELDENRILPLRVQRESFAYHADVKVLEQYYQELWRIYIFVSPEVYENSIACQAIIDKFCDIYNIPQNAAYNKVRRYDFKIDHDKIAQYALQHLYKFFNKKNGRGFPFVDIPLDIIAGVLTKAANDEEYLKSIKYDQESIIANIIVSLFYKVILEKELNKLKENSEKTKDNEEDIKQIENYIKELDSNKKSPFIFEVEKDKSDNLLSFNTYSAMLIDRVISKYTV